jgi:hypothetical protein
LANTATCGAAGTFSIATRTAGAITVVVVTLIVSNKVVGGLATGAAGTTGTTAGAIGDGEIGGNNNARLVVVVLGGNVDVEEDEGVVGDGNEVVVADVEVDVVLVDVVVEVEVDVDDVLVDVLVEVDVEVEDEEDDGWSRAQIVRLFSRTRSSRSLLVCKSGVWTEGNLFGEYSHLRTSSTNGNVS